MSRTKSEKFSKSSAKLAQGLRALAHPARLDILEALATRGECVCGEIVDLVPLAQATVSQHLKVLREAELIQGEIEGVKSCYCVNQAGLEELKADVALFFSKTGIGRGNGKKCC